MPAVAPTSRNFVEMRERLRQRLSRRKAERNGQGGCELQHNDPTVPKANVVAGPNLNRSADVGPGETMDDRDLDELISFINGTSESNKDAKKSKAKKKKKKEKKDKNAANNANVAAPTTTTTITTAVKQSELPGADPQAKSNSSTSASKNNKENALASPKPLPKQHQESATSATKGKKDAGHNQNDAQKDCVKSTQPPVHNGTSGGGSAVTGNKKSAAQPVVAKETATVNGKLNGHINDHLDYSSVDQKSKITNVNGHVKQDHKQQKLKEKPNKSSRSKKKSDDALSPGTSSTSQSLRNVTCVTCVSVPQMKCSCRKATSIWTLRWTSSRRSWKRLRGNSVDAVDVVMMLMECACRFCYDSKPLAHKEKINVNVKDIFVKNEKMKK